MVTNMEMRSAMIQLLAPFTLMKLPSVDVEDTCFHISRMGIVRGTEQSAIDLELPEGYAEHGVERLILHPPGRFTKWEKFTGRIYYVAQGRFGLHTADSEKILGEVMDEGTSGHLNVNGELCCTFSLDDWALEARCKAK